MANSFYSNSNDPFDRDMDDIFNQLMGRLNGLNSESHYLVNGREMTPEEFAQYRATGQLPASKQNQVPITTAQQHKQKKDGILDKLGRNLTEEAR